MSRALHEILKDSPALLWPCDGLTTVAGITDISGNGRDGTQTGTITGPSAPIMHGSLVGSLGFAGAGGSNYLHRAHDAALDVGTGDFSWEMWVVVTNGTGNYVELAARDNSQSGNGQIFRLQTGTGFIQCYIGGTALLGSHRVSDSAVHHLALVRASGVGTVYLDGAVEATGAAAGNADTSSDVRLGVVDGSFPTLNGEVSLMAYYTASLSATRVAAHFAAGSAEGVVC
jgi:hypothetical protein